MTKISILLPTYNCDRTIEHTLKSVAWADEILVIDSFSNDKTLQIVKKYGAKVIQHEYINSAKQKNWALKFVSHDWVFQIDSDELLDPGAGNIIRDTIANAAEYVYCFKMHRKNHVLGKWVKHGGMYPDWEYRLFRKGYGEWFEREVHSRVMVSGAIELLDTPLVHYGMPNISKQLINLDRYTRYEADELNKSHKRFSYFKWLIGPPFVFLKRYIYLQGFRDGWRGFFLAIYASFYLFISHTKLLEIELLNLKRSPK